MGRQTRGLLGTFVRLAGLVSGVAPGAEAAQPAPPSHVPLPSIVEQTTAELNQGPGRSQVIDPASLSSDILHVDHEGRIELAFSSTRALGAAEKATLEALGATGVVTVPGVGLIQAFVPAAEVDTASTLPWVAAVTAPTYGNVDVGSVTSEGVAFHRADLAQTAGINGAGIKLGAVSDGVSNIAASIALGDLPNTVNVLNAGSGDEGTAMLEIIHDMAPGVGLLFNSTGNSLATHVNALNNLVVNGAQVIAEDIAFDAEPAFQVGLAAQTAENIAAAGVSVHSSAGNLGSRHTARVTATGTGQRPDNTANTFTGCTKTPHNVVDIDPGAGTAFDVTASGGNFSATLQWSEPRAVFPTAGRGGFTDLNFYVMDAALTKCLAQSVGVQSNGTGDTLEQVSLNLAAGTNVKLVVDVEGTSSAVAAPTLDLRWRGANAIDPPTRAGSLNPDSNYTGLAAAAAAMDAVGGGIEPYGAGGPVQLGSTTICPGGAAGPCTGVAGGGLVSSPGPTWAAADNVQVSGVGGFPSPFRGTSASAPHAAACDALVRQGQAGISVATVVNRLKATAIDVAPPGPDNVTGAGRLDCFAAVNANTTPQPPCTSTLTGDIQGFQVVSSGQHLCLVRARLEGTVTVNSGGAVSVTDSQVSGGIRSDGSGFVRICASRVSGGISVGGSSGPVTVGDAGAGCPTNDLSGGIVLSNNRGPVVLGDNRIIGNTSVTNNVGGPTVVKANTIVGSLGCDGNVPPPTNAGAPNSASNGKTGQCAAL